ncbi:hypothetical protein JL720_52 [Aureococcus anophagefferens]|nr:hypothetical protein JL720_52 [Aureococcus anophagefferens]
MMQLSMIERSRADGPVVVSREALELLRALALRLLRALEPVNDRSAYFDARLFDDSISSLDVVAWLVADAGNDASSAQDAHWVGQALVAHGFLRRAARRAAPAPLAAMHAESRRRPAARPTRRAVAGGAVAFETTVDGGAAFPDASWDEAYEVGCNLGERVELRVVDRDGGLGGTNLGDLDLASRRPRRRGGARARRRRPAARMRAPRARRPRPRRQARPTRRAGGATCRHAATGGHGSDSATLCAHVAVFPRGDDGGGAARGAAAPAGGAAPTAGGGAGADRWRRRAALAPRFGPGSGTGRANGSSARP